MNRQSRCHSFRKPKTNPRNGWRTEKYGLTAAEKMMVRAARKENWTYSQIVRVLGRPKETIRRFCSRDGIASEPIKRKVYRKPLTECQWCGEKYKSLPADRTPCCSRMCSGAWRSYQNKGPQMCYSKTRDHRHSGICMDCYISFIAGSYNQKYCPECQHKRNKKRSREDFHRKYKYLHDKRDRSPRICRECGKMFSPEYGNKRRSFCSKKCLLKHNRRIAKGSRRARIHGLFHEAIDPIDIFRRDKWICQICGIKTPRNKRGLLVNDAPELDHVIALSNGGTHTWDNVQCLCRECNINKGARTIGQLGLRLAV